MTTPALDIAMLLDATLDPTSLAARVPAVSPMARVECLPTAASMPVGEAIAMAISLLPKAPDLDVVALSAPGRLQGAIAHHAALAVLTTLLQHRGSQ